MIALDTNFLVYAHRSDNPFHAIARAALARLAASPLPFGVPVVCVHEFLAVSTNARIFKQPTPLALAFEQIEQLLAQPSARLLGPGARHLAVLRQISEPAALSGGQMHDARIAAICLEHGVHELWTADRDFKAFPQITCRGPLDLVRP